MGFEREFEPLGAGSAVPFLDLVEILGEPSEGVDPPSQLEVKK